MDTISAREREEWTPSVQGRGRNGHHQCKGEEGMDTISARDRMMEKPRSYACATQFSYAEDKKSYDWSTQFP